jgi:AcrR family transcriptional regulator
MISRGWDGRVQPSRERLIAAVVPLVLADGREEVTATAIASRAGITASEFSRHFTSAEDCRRAAFDAVCDRFDRHLLPIYLRPEPWRLRMRVAAYAAVDFCRDHEEQVRFAIGERLRHRHLHQGERSLRLHLREIESARLEAPVPELVPSSAAEFAVGCFLELAVRCHASGDFRQLEQSLPALLYRVIAAFFGPVAAEEELERLRKGIPPDASS